MTITDKPTCRRRLWGDVDGLLCCETKPHTPGPACRFVSGMADETSEPQGHGGHR